MNADTMGAYGNYYLKRAIVTEIGLGANLPEDAIYPINLFDSTRQPLDGANKYTIHFDKGATPPADAFWSITLYDKDGFQIANGLNRFAVSSWMPSSNTTVMARSICISRTRAPAPIWKQTGCPRPGAVQSHDAAVCAPIGGAHRQVEIRRRLSRTGPSPLQAQ